MKNDDVLAILFALGSALTIAWGTVVRHRIAEQNGDSNPETSDIPILAAIRKPWWWAGLFSALFGYFLQIVALRFGSLLIVQPILVLKLMFTLPLASKFDGRRISKSETGWATVLSIAVGVLVVFGKPTPGLSAPPAEKWAVAVAIGAAVFYGMYRFARIQHRREKALVYGLITGGIMGYLAVLSKAVVDVWSHEGALGLVTSWELYGLLFCAGLGTSVQQTSFNAGALKDSLPAMTIAEPIVAFSLGYLILREQFRVSGWHWSYVIASIVLMIVGTFVLSRKSVKD
ncbi:DMT family transporter [uncultured Corynebacterium sp.]|uniref:DMT family transporter n=1 Tax=uncultured Corynebacterium sp. TaxID=159447 RepID=UPI0025D7085D|nr:DMT family transporter [uncultured Corynebacterium sp.]